MTIPLTRAAHLQKQILELLPELRVPYDSEVDPLWNALKTIDDQTCKFLNGLCFDSDREGLRGALATLTKKGNT